MKRKTDNVVLIGFLVLTTFALFFIICGDAKAQDKVKQDITQQKIETLEKRANNAEAAFIEKYLKDNNMTLSEAFMQLYYQNRGMQQILDNAKVFVNRVANVEDMEELNKVLDEFGIKKDGE